MLRAKNSRRSPYSHQLPARVGHQAQPRPAGHHHQAERVKPGPARPHYNPHHTQPSEVRETAEETLYQDRICTLCSDKEHEVSHHHVSSESVRVFAKRHMRKFLFSCIMCKADESVVRPNTRKLILTTSTLYNVWAQATFKPDIHVEIESIVGGRYRDLTRALMMLYLVQPERLEVIVIAGLNNIGEGQSVPEILDEIYEMRQSVKAHTNMYNHNPPSVISISTVLYAPKFCSLDVPTAFPEWLPPPGFNNRRRDIECLNSGIAAVNKGSGVNYLNLHYEGVRMDPKSKKVMHKHNPARPVWRELDIRKRLHLTHDNKVKVTNQAINLFKGGLTNIGCWDSKKPRV